MARYGFNVTIGADTSAFSAALRKLNTPIKEAQTSFKKISDGLKLNPTNITLLGNKLAEMKTQAAASETKVNSLKEALKNYENAATDGYKQTDEYKMHVRDLTTEIETENEKLKALNKQILLFGSAGTQQFIAVGQKVQEFGNKVSAVGQKLMPLSMATGALLTGAVKSAADFEHAWVGVTKTVEGTDEELAKVRQDIIDLSKATGISKNEIAGVAQVAGQLGIKTQDLSEFTKVMVDLGVATDLTAEESAMAIAKIANITGMTIDEYSKFGASLTALGNNFATQESNILEMATRLASTGDLVGLTEAQILALSTAMNSLGAEAEAGGTAMSKMFRKMQLSIETGDKNLSKFAKVAGMSVKDFKKAFETDALGALNAFVKGLGKIEESGGSAVATLDDMKLSEVRLSDSLLKLVSSGDMLDRTLQVANQGWEENTALTNEANKRYNETIAKWGQVKETLGEIAIIIGDTLLPTIKDLLDGLKGFLDRISKMSDGTKKFITTLLLIVTALGPALVIIGKIIKFVGIIISAIGKIKLAIEILTVVLGIPLGPILAIVAAVAAVIAVFVLLYKKCDWFRNGVNAIVSAIVNKLKEIWEWLKNFFTVTIPSWIDFAKEILGNLPYYIGYLWGMIIASIVNFGISIWNWITTDLPKIIEGIVDWFKKLPRKNMGIFKEDSK